MSDPIFVLDSNVFMEAARRYYAFDIAPSFWNSLIVHARNGRIESIDRIKKEIDRGKDDLANWANNHFHFAFVSTDANAIVTSYTQIMTWVNTQAQFTDAAKADFARSPDGWLVAYADAKKRTVVTNEVLAPDAKARVKIPNVCQAFNVPFVNTYEMLRILEVRFS